ncbi:hypothetical protein D5S17_11330 [Pseudonocardiaceae bacterium YIM PH 21723]|nr:hypothetical protein D5S17_11330 [Pseudonocardiaceae bacterium YIM PH 21723]
MSLRRTLTLLSATVLTAAVGLSLPSAQADPAQLFEYAVDAPSTEHQQQLLQKFDVLEDRDGNTLYVLGNRSTATELGRAGFTPTVHRELKPITGAKPSTRLVPGAPQPADPIDETFYGGYHTVNAHYAHLDKVAKEHPELATPVVYGKSYLKTKNPAAGYDLRAICLTKKQTGDCALNPNSAKPRFVMDTQIHARELGAGDMSWRYLDHLVNGYGKDAAITTLLDTTEVWLIPIVNPDGVDYVQQGGANMGQRKNRDAENGSCAGATVGIDLNRNWGFKWGQGGSSSSPCNDGYMGPRADSEPETQAMQKLYTQLFPVKGNDGTAAVGDVRGLAFSIHSTMGAHMFPPGWDTSNGPDFGPLNRIAGKMASYTGYKYGPIGKTIYVATGSTLDWAYGKLGVAGFVTELKSCGSFNPPYSCQAGDWAANLPTFMYLASVAAHPYQQ